MLTTKKLLEMTQMQTAVNLKKRSKDLSETLNFRVGKMWTLRCQFWKYIFGY